MGEDNPNVWDCVMHVFSKPERKGLLLDNVPAVRNAMIELMQTHAAFARVRFKTEDTGNRITAFETAVQDVLSDSVEIAKPVPPELRETMISDARKTGNKCAICKNTLPADIYIQIDHIKPRAKGGSSKKENLQVVCKRCNQKKGANAPLVSANAPGLAEAFSQTLFGRDP